MYALIFYIEGESNFHTGHLHTVFLYKPTFTKLIKVLSISDSDCTRLLDGKPIFGIEGEKEFYLKLIKDGEIVKSDY